MKILVSLPKRKDLSKNGESIDEFLEGTTPCSGTMGSIIRLASLLDKGGFDVCLSANHEVVSSQLTCIKHEEVEAGKFDFLIVHESHWNGSSLTFGNQALNKTFLWLHLYSCFAMVYTFIKAGGYRVVCPSVDCANAFRAVPKWSKKVVVAYNSYNPIFSPNSEKSEHKLLFVGAIKPSKGFTELMKIWSYLVNANVNLKLAIAGSIHLHNVQTQTGSLGVADKRFEVDYIEPWLKGLPTDYQPNFLGALTPQQLQKEINRSWAIIVNPSWKNTETFCVSAVEAEACNKTVFSVAIGGLKETVYQGKFQSLATKSQPETLGKLILNGLSDREAVAENGRLAGDYVREKFSLNAIQNTWIQLLNNQTIQPSLPKIPTNSRDLFRDLMRYSQTSVMYYSYRSPHDRKILSLIPKS